MVTYEITAIVRPDLCAAYVDFMRERHMPDLLATGAFTAANIATSGPSRYRIRYEARSRAALDEYLAKDAPRLRQHFMSTFPDGIELSREEWLVLESWPGSG